MAVWTTPITWSNGAVTAATMNTEVRDHFNWLKNALDLITNSTAADSGTATILYVTRAASTDGVINGRVSGDSNPRVQIQVDGSYNIGTGASAVDTYFLPSGGGISFARPAVMTVPGKAYIKAGALNDTDIPGTYTGSGSGMFGLDTTNSRVYFRVGSTWKFAALT